jgi:hypothetical protein
MSIEPSQHIISQETIRARFKRRVRWAVGLGFGGLAFCILAPVAGLPKEYLFLPGVGAIVFVIALFVSQWLAKCPKCETRLGQELTYKVAFHLWGKTPNFCPYCGVSFDSPWPE